MSYTDHDKEVELVGNLLRRLKENECACRTRHSIAGQWATHQHWLEVREHEHDPRLVVITMRPDCGADVILALLMGRS